MEQIGTPLDLYDRPDNLFVASFIGSPSMNLLPGRVRTDGAPAFVTDDGVVVPLPGAGPGPGLDGRPMLLGIRPEHFALDAGGVEALVDVVEPTGYETQVRARVGTQEIMAVLRDRPAIGPGDRITLRPAPAGLHLFDADSGRRMLWSGNTR